VLTVELPEDGARAGDAEPARAEQRPDEPQPAHVVVAVPGLRGAGALALGQQPLAQVVLDRGDRHPGRLGELGDAHGLPLDIG